MYEILMLPGAGSERVAEHWPRRSTGQDKVVLKRAGSILSPSLVTTTRTRPLPVLMFIHVAQEAHFCVLHSPWAQRTCRQNWGQDGDMQFVSGATWMMLDDSLLLLFYRAKIILP